MDLGARCAQCTNILPKHLFYYNRKMCYAGDAEKWKNLSDPGYVTLAPNGSTTISISENLTATSIAISYKNTSNHTRYIFYEKSANLFTQFV